MGFLSPPDFLLRRLAAEALLKVGLFGMANPGKRLDRKNREVSSKADSVPAPQRHPQDAMIGGLSRALSSLRVRGFWCLHFPRTARAFYMEMQFVQ
ncbi:hypothetical protein ACU4GI_12325 [Cupriavidus basilensis]